MQEKTQPMGASELEQLADKRIELKFMLDEPLAESVMHWARQHLGVDAHCDSRWGDSYEVNTLYLDNDDFDVYYRREGVDGCKHRLRRYGHEHTVWLETKRKRNFVVHKNRTAVDEHEVARWREQVQLQETRTADPALTSQMRAAPESLHRQSHCDNASTVAWCGDWFANRVVQLELKPVVLVHYRRFARTAYLGGESLRLTIDSEIEARVARDWSVATRDEGRQIEQVQQIGGARILELKFNNSMPALFKQLLQAYPILATQFSKFRTAVNICCPVSSKLGQVAHGAQSDNDRGARVQESWLK
jgi:hypothetical protein